MLRIKNKLIFDPADYRNTIFLTGSGRSGTTWVQEIINTHNEFRVMFEPFHSDKVSLLNGWYNRQYIRNFDQSDNFISPANIILSGSIRHKWIDRHNYRMFAKKRIIKDIRTQLMLKWIKTNFPEIPIIMIMRHPCAVANSRIRANWGTFLNEFIAQEQLVNDFLSPFIKYIKESNSTFENQLFMWCIENYVPLKQFNPGEILLIFYENICSNPQNEISKILNFLNINYDYNYIKKSKKPSSVSHKDSAIISGGDFIKKWKSFISANQINRAVQILSIFGLQNIYNESCYPLLNDSDALNIFSV